MPNPVARFFCTVSGGFEEKSRIKERGLKIIQIERKKKIYFIERIGGTVVADSECGADFGNKCSF